MLAMTDADPVETGEWIDSLRAVVHHQGRERASFLLDRLREEAQLAGASAPLTLNTPYVNTIPPEREERANWDRDIEHRIRSIIRWNAVAIILRSNKGSSELGGHIASSRRPRSMTSALVTSGARRRISTAATSSISRATPGLASTRGPSSRAGSPSNSF